MNDIIILGNGFDLAHGLATGYKDYVRAMLIDSLMETAKFPISYEDSPFRIKGAATMSCSYVIDPEGISNEETGSLTKLYDSTLKLAKHHLPRFTKRILEGFDREGWVGLEETYFSSLKGYITEEGSNKRQIIPLNQQMEKLRTSLCQYLTKLEQPAPSEDIRSLLEQIKRGQIERAWEQARNYNFPRMPETRVYAWQVEERLSSGITVLTFNYTDTCEVLYKDALTIKVKDASNCSLVGELKDDIPPTFIYIHGSLEEGDIVLGYGDETTDKFRELEDANDNELTKYFKSFYYMQNSRYRQFFEVLERGPFRLHLMGHSCGLSDRVLLSSIFNHPNLEDVKIYYHDRGENNNDYFQLCQNISRHFHDKHAMRLKILPCKGEDPNMMSVPLIPHKKS